jgi:hypothetical protein
MLTAFQFSKALAQLDAVQQKIEISLGNNQKVWLYDTHFLFLNIFFYITSNFSFQILSQTQAKFSENVERIQSNFENLEQRLSSLKK